MTLSAADFVVFEVGTVGGALGRDEAGLRGAATVTGAEMAGAFVTTVGRVAGLLERLVPLVPALALGSAAALAAASGGLCDAGLPAGFGGGPAACATVGLGGFLGGLAPESARCNLGGGAGSSVVAVAGRLGMRGWREVDIRAAAWASSGGSVGISIVRCGSAS